MMARLLKASGAIEDLDVPDTGLSAEQLHALVDGYIEVVMLERPSRHSAALVINDDGRRRGLPLNMTATMLYRASLQRPVLLDDIIVGDAVLVVILDPGLDSERFT